MNALGISPIEDPSYVIGLAAALVFGALIGLERQFRRHPAAGLHINALVSLGAAAYVVAAMLLGDETGPARVAGQVVTGVGFLCAGVIIHQGQQYAASIQRRRSGVLPPLVCWPDWDSRYGPRLSPCSSLLAT